jgi:hypothetical protein
MGLIGATTKGNLSGLLGHQTQQKTEVGIVAIADIANRRGKGCCGPHQAIDFLQMVSTNLSFSPSNCRLKFRRPYSASFDATTYLL